MRSIDICNGSTNHFQAICLRNRPCATLPRDGDFQSSPIVTHVLFSRLPLRVWYQAYVCRLPNPRTSPTAGGRPQNVMNLKRKKKCGAQASVWACNITALLCLARFDPNQCIMTLYSVQARLAGPPPFLLEPIDRIDGPKSGPLRSAATARFWSHDLQKSALVARNDEGAFCIVWGPEKKGGWGT